MTGKPYRCAVLGLLVVCAAAEVQGGYWKQQGRTEYPNKNMAPNSGAATSGPAHNGTCLGTLSAPTTYSETRDMGEISRWGEVVHEMTRWESSLDGFPNSLLAGEVVPIKGRLAINSNTWRGTTSQELDVWMVCYLSREGANEFPNTRGRIADLLNLKITASSGTSTQTATNRDGRAPMNDGVGTIYLVWRAAWGVSAGTADGDIFEARVPYVWIDDTPSPATDPGSAHGSATAAMAARPGRNAYLFETEKLASPNGKFTLLMQTDGNLVIYKSECVENPGCAVWNSRTYRETGQYYLAMQDDGNLVIYRGRPPDDSSKAIWNTQTYRERGSYFLSVQDDGSLAIHAGTAPSGDKGVIWSSK